MFTPPVSNTAKKFMKKIVPDAMVVHQLQGSTASALIKETLKYGNDRNSIINNIRNGIPATEMIRWDSTLPDDDIEAYPIIYFK
jgi:hypothetical protein